MKDSSNKRKLNLITDSLFEIQKSHNRDVNTFPSCHVIQIFAQLSLKQAEYNYPNYKHAQNM